MKRMLTQLSNHEKDVNTVIRSCKGYDTVIRSWTGC